MSIEHVHTRVQLLHADDAARYLIHDPREIRAIVKGLIATRALLSARLLPGSDSVLSTVLELDETTGELLLDGSTDTAQNQRIARAETLDCVTQLDRIRIEFLLEGQRYEEDAEGRPRFRAPLPTELLRLQRREFYRLQTPLTHIVTCRIPLPDGDAAREAELRILDISGSGVAIAVPPSGLELEPGMEFAGCELKLPDTAPIAARLIVRNLFRITTRHGAVMLRAGCEFADMPRGAEDAIQRYILNVERERNARKLGRL